MQVLRQDPKRVPATPSTMKMTIAATLIMANQYSNVPKFLTLLALMAMRDKENATTKYHNGTCGNQNCA